MRADQGGSIINISSMNGKMAAESRVVYGATKAAVNLLTAISTTPTVPMVRAPWLDPPMIMKLLDAGAYGLICPMVSTGADAEALARATRYPPMGSRSYGPIRALLYGGGDYPEHANETIAVLAMIETRAGIDNLDDILSVPGIDAVYIGPSDLSLALGCKPTFDDVEKPVAEAIDLVLAKAKEHGKIAGIHNGTPESAMRRVEKGFQFVTVGSDARLIATGSRQILNAMHRDPPKLGGVH